MKLRLRILILISLSLVLLGCPVPGKVVLKRVEGGKWIAAEVETKADDITPAFLKRLEDRLNGQ